MANAAPRPRRCALLTACAAGILPAGCAGIQSSLDPSGREAEQIAGLFWWMTGAALIVWVAVIALAVYCVRVVPESRTVRRDRLLIIGGGALLPTLVLTALLVYGLAMLPPLMSHAPAGSLTIAVVGEQWWWRVRYLPDSGAPIELANEIRLPVGEPVQFRLASDNVIHSFWVPSLAGKIDMIPGRITHLSIRPTATGVFRGACAEYCGTSHALMSLYVEVMPREEFDRWLAGQARPVQPPATAMAGRQLFLANGCSACHTIRGTPAGGAIGPDLTHVGSRLSLAAGILPNEPEAFHRWLARTDNVKPGVHMPAFGMLPDTELRELAEYLEGLK